MTTDLFSKLIKAHVSEKSMRVADKYKQIVFYVRPETTKSQIKKIIEKLFSVKVRKVSTSNFQGKSKTFKQKQGKQKSFKKAYVSLEEGYDIDLLSAE